MIICRPGIGSQFSRNCASGGGGWKHCNSFIISIIIQHEHLMVINCFLLSTCHFINSFLLMLGRIIRRRCLFLPWFVTQIVFIINGLIVFLTWTYVSMFASWWETMVFPFISGLTVGVMVHNWRRVYQVYRSHCQLSVMSKF